MLVLPLLLVVVPATTIAAVPLLDDCQEVTCSASTLGGSSHGQTRQLLQKSLYHASPPEVAQDRFPEVEYQHWQLASLMPADGSLDSASEVDAGDAQFQSDTMLPLVLDPRSRELVAEEQQSIADVPHNWHDAPSSTQSRSRNIFSSPEPAARSDTKGRIHRGKTPSSIQHAMLLEELSPVGGQRNAALRQVAEAQNTEAEIRDMADADVRDTLRVAAKHVHDIIANAKKVITAEDRAVHTLLDAVGPDQVGHRAVSTGNSDFAILHTQHKNARLVSHLSEDPDCSKGSGDGMQGKVSCGPLNYMTTFGYRLDIFPGVLLWVVISLCLCSGCSLMVRIIAV